MALAVEAKSALSEVAATYNNQQTDEAVIFMQKKLDELSKKIDELIQKKREQSAELRAVKNENRILQRRLAEYKKIDVTGHYKIVI